MRAYLNVVIALNFLVDFLLLLGANRIAGFSQSWKRCLLAAVLGGIYGGVCLLPGFRFLGNTVWRLAALAVMGAIAFGLEQSGLRRMALFIFLSMALSGVAVGFEKGSVLSWLSGAVLLWLLCVFGFHRTAMQQEFVEVELRRGERHTTLTALRDTGNTLCDPVTGQGVLVADAQTAFTLLGLTRQQLRTPVETVACGAVPGLRLIPYCTVGQPGGMLVAIRLEQVRIGKWKGSALVAFAPDGLGKDHTYRALIGGMA